MKNIDDVAITAFLDFKSDSIIKNTKKMIMGRGLKIEEEKAKDKLIVLSNESEARVEFNLRNILLEIATIDRDDESLRFDHKLLDLDYCIYKSMRVIWHKLDVLELILNKVNDQDFLESLDECDQEGKKL